MAALLLAACASTPASGAVEVHPLSVPRRAGFEANRGQWPAPVRFVARDGAATLFLTADQAVWRLRDGATARMQSAQGPEEVRGRGLEAPPPRPEQAVYRMDKEKCLPPAVEKRDPRSPRPLMGRVHLGNVG